jgi:thiosulfate/3-mercaptopyruvate sulfurtransferase
MKIKISMLLLLAVATSSFASCFSSSQGQNDPWTQQQLLAPVELANTIINPKLQKPIIFSIGMQAIVKGSIDIGPAMVAENLNILKQKLGKLPKNAAIVVYCGCCPFSRCPNIRPAMALLKEMQFTNYKLLNLPQNVKVDWIDKGYPMNE